jgi:hypothetical protein
LIISIVNKGKDEGEVDDDDDRAKRKEKEKDSSSQCALFSARRKKGRTKQSRIHFGGVYFVKEPKLHKITAHVRGCLL